MSNICPEDNCGICEYPAFLSKVRIFEINPCHDILGFSLIDYSKANYCFSFIRVLSFDSSTYF